MLWTKGGVRNGEDCVGAVWQGCNALIVLVFLKHCIFQQVLIQELFVNEVVCGVIFCLFRKGRLVKISCDEFVDKG